MHANYFADYGWVAFERYVQCAWTDAPPFSSAAISVLFAQMAFFDSFTGETIPIRLFLGGFDLTPTFREVNKKYSTRYYLSLVLIDEGQWSFAFFSYTYHSSSKGPRAACGSHASASAICRCFQYSGSYSSLTPTLRAIQSPPNPQP